jgi:hypothetical protein
VKRAIANFLLKLAISMGAKRVTVNVIRDIHSPSVADAILTAPLWQDGNADDWSKYLASDNGKLLSLRLRRIAAEVAINGARDQRNTVHAAGVTAGWDECVRYLHSLSRVSRVEDTKHTEQAPQDEASLLEQLSP